MLQIAKGKPMRPKKCGCCKSAFSPARPMQKACSPLCALTIARDNRLKDERKAHEAKKKALRPRAEWQKLAQAAFNRYIRLRDAQLPCVSCGRMHDGQWHAGHYMSTGARPELRFDEANVHKQCQPCNTHLHGNLVLYRVELIRRVGMAEVQRLEGPQVPNKFTSLDLIAIRDKYVAKAKALEKGTEELEATA